MTVVFGIAAMAVDLGTLYSAQAEMQRAADAAALTGAWELMSEERLFGGAAMDDIFLDAASQAAAMAATNIVYGLAPVLDTNEDVDVGHWSFSGGDGSLHYGDPSRFNAVAVVLQRNADRGGSIALSFARLMGIDSSDLTARATAAALDGVVGFEIGSNGQNVQLLPYALHVDVWNNYISGYYSHGDDYSYDPDTGAVTSGSDGIPELNIFPGAGTHQLPPGNFGTVDIGSPNNSTADLRRQILYGINEYDLSFFGGRLVLGDDGTLNLNGDTGISAGVKDDLESIKGQPRSIPLFREVSGPGNNANFVVVGFAGVRIVNVRFTGAMKSKELRIQPAVVVDGSAVATGDSESSYYIYRTPQLVQ